MIRCIIVEDEPLAVERLEGQLQLLTDTEKLDMEVLACLDSIKGTMAFLQNNASPDLIFLDIHLADGLSFQIFEKMEVKSPIIFTTAYDQYAIKAFKLNSIDYLLKPIDTTDLKNALQKFQEKQTTNSSPSISLAQIQEAMAMVNKTFKTRFIIKKGERLLSVTVDKIACFYSEDKYTILQTIEGQKFMVSYTIQELTEQLNLTQFFRINRKYIVHINAIADIVAYSNSRLKINLQKNSPNDAIVSREKVQQFKKWLDQ